MSVIAVNENNFDAEVIQSDRPVLIDFWAAWCGPCRMLSPIVDEVAAERSDIKVCKVNVDEVPALAEQFSVMSIPSLFLLKGGKVIASSIGAKPKNELLRKKRKSKDKKKSFANSKKKRGQKKMNLPETKLLLKIFLMQ